jgi:hypothetical protein
VCPRDPHVSPSGASNSSSRSQNKKPPTMSMALAMTGPSGRSSQMGTSKTQRSRGRVAQRQPGRPDASLDRAIAHTRSESQHRRPNEAQGDVLHLCARLVLAEATVASSLNIAATAISEVTVSGNGSCSLPTMRGGTTPYAKQTLPCRRRRVRVLPNIKRHKCSSPAGR